ncbi:hypothetical protein [Serratia ficaria]|uniref:hypothetical protein n=1 Tax=Serratia ficaria TaxID=61651 RepID=UPI000AFD3E98|nr:hypothetical protein [Serratia ficaria]
MISETKKQQLRHALNNPLKAGYVTYTGYVLTEDEAEQYNRYTEAACKPSNSESAVQFYLDQRHLFYVLCCEGTSGEGKGADS